MRVLGVFFVVIGLALIGAGTLAYQWYRQPLALPTTPFDFDVRVGSTLSAVARELRDAGVIAHPLALTMLGRVKGVDRTIKAHCDQLVACDLNAGDIAHARALHADEPAIEYLRAGPTVRAKRNSPPTAGSSEAGSAWARLPHTVPRLRMTR